MGSIKEQERKRVALSYEIVHSVISDLRTFGLIRETSDTVLGQAIFEAAQHIEAKLPNS